MEEGLGVEEEGEGVVEEVGDSLWGGGGLASRASPAL